MYRTLMTDAGFAANVVENLGQLLIGGLREQGTINSASKDLSLTRTEKRLRREGKEWYQQAIEVPRENSGFTTPRMALWSGGFDVCEYARSKGTPKNANPAEERQYMGPGTPGARNPSAPRPGTGCQRGEVTTSPCISSPPRS